MCCSHHITALISHGPSAQAIIPQTSESDDEHQCTNPLPHAYLTKPNKPSKSSTKGCQGCARCVHGHELVCHRANANSTQARPQGLLSTDGGGQLASTRVSRSITRDHQCTTDPVPLTKAAPCTLALAKSTAWRKVRCDPIMPLHWCQESGTLQWTDTTPVRWQ